FEELTPGDEWVGLQTPCELLPLGRSVFDPPHLGIAQANEAERLERGLSLRTAHELAEDAELRHLGVAEDRGRITTTEALTHPRAHRVVVGELRLQLFPWQRSEGAGRLQLGQTCA